MTDVPQQVKRIRMDPADRRKQILSVAREVFIESGYSGAKMSDVAERSGITNAFVYHHFKNKRDLYTSAVREPIEELINDLVSDIDAMDTRHVDRVSILRHFHELLLRYMAEAGPLLGVALLSDSQEGRDLYADFVYPKFSAAIESVIQQVTGWTRAQVDLGLLVKATFGVHLGIALWRLLDQRPEDFPGTSKQLAALFGAGVSVNKSGRMDGALMLAEGPNARKVKDHLVLAGNTSRERSYDPAELFRKRIQQVLRRPLQPPVDSAPGTRRRLTEAERRAKIMQASRDVFVESGINGARTKQIALQAGITEAFMFRLYDSKEQLYQESVERPAGEVWKLLTLEIETLAHEPDITGLDLFRQINRLILIALVAAAPLLGVVLFSDINRGRQLTERIAGHSMSPFRRIQAVVSHATGWTEPAISADVVMRAIMGVHLGLAVDAMFSEERIDVIDTADRLTTMLATGIREDRRRGTA